jgi:hypothetical protein
MKLFRDTASVQYNLIIIFWALLYALGRFPGLESHSGYYGMTFALIHPESFPGDLTNNYHPGMVSWYGLLVKIFGDLWLDDRFNLGVYFILVVLCMWAVDRMAKLLGVKDKWGRLAALAILLAHHTFIDNIPRLIDTICYRPSTYVYPLGLWLAYFFLKGDRWKQVLLLCFLLISMSLKNGWFPGCAGILLVCREKLGWKWSRIAWMGAGGLSVFFLGHYFWGLWNGKIIENVLLFDLTLSTTENSEANPFMDGLGPFLYIALLGITFFVRLSDERMTNRLRYLCIFSAMIYILGGIYYSIAPDVIKVPLFVALAVSRSTWWTQLIIFLVLSCDLIKRLESASLKKNLWPAALLILLYLFPVVDYLALRNFFRTYALTIEPILVSRLLIILFFTMGMIVLYWFLKKGYTLEKGVMRKLLNPISIVLFPLIICATLSAIHKTYSRLPHIVFLFRHGIVGDTAGAKWVGINEFLRYETPQDSTILALAGNDLAVDTSLRIRSGRTMLLSNHEIAFYFNYPKRLKQLELSETSSQFSRNWQACRMDAIKQDLDLIENPDYIVVPKDKVCDPQALDYVLEKEINSFAVLKRGASG